METTDGNGQYCATLKFQGSFETLEGTSPNGGNELLAAGVVGTWQGGYTYRFNGDFDPQVRTKGSIPTFNHQCDFEFATCGGGDSLLDPPTKSWVPQFFIPESFSIVDFGWWGFIYHAGNNGTWIDNAGDLSGDITGGF